MVLSSCVPEASAVAAHDREGGLLRNLVGTPGPGAQASEGE